MKTRTIIWEIFSGMVLINLSFSLYAAELDASIKEIATELAPQINLRTPKKIAVASFSDLNGRQSALGAFIAEELNIALFSAGKFDVVERREFDNVSTYAKLI